MSAASQPPAHAVVLTAGLGMRLRPLTLVRAKPAVPVANEPLVRRIVGWLAGQGVTDLVLNLHHLPHTIAAVIGEGSDLGVRVRYSWEQPQVLGTAGGPRLAQLILGVESYFLINGDTLTDLSLREIWSAHAASGALVTLALVKNTEPHRYGGIVLNADGIVTGVVPAADAAPSYHFIGVQAVQAEAFSSVIPGSVANSIGGVFDRLIADRPGSVRGYVCDAGFWDIGTVPDYWRTSLALSAGLDSGPDRPHGNIHPSATLIRSIVWDDVEVGEGSMVEECILTDGVRVAPGRVCRRSILLRTKDGATMAVPFTTD